MKYRKKQVEVEAITFDELVEYGRTHGANIVNGMPRDFEWEGCLVERDSDKCYLIYVLNTGHYIYPNYVAVKNEYGKIYTKSIDQFKIDYESYPLPDLPQSATDILRSKIQPIANIIVAYEKQFMQFDDAGIEICNLFDKEMEQLEVAKKLLTLLLTGNGTGHKEMEELRREWESVNR